MQKKIMGQNVNYESYGKKSKREIVLLHGWGQNIEMMKPLGNLLMNRYHITIIDLPGFGKSEEPKTVWHISTYADMVHQLLLELGIKKPVLIGHSFGGKISLCYASKYPTAKLVLLASPFRKGYQKLPLKTRILKVAKKIPGMRVIAEKAKKYIGSSDYKNASPRMRSILVEHVNSDITEDVKKITCPTILIWGDRDSEVNIDEAYVLESLIPDAAVIPYEGCTHYAYLERLNQTANIVKNFIEE